MATNDFLPFATAGGANVITQSEYAALAARLTGFVNGIALPEQANKSWRQSSLSAAAIGDLIASYGGLDALDDGNVANLSLAIARTLQSAPWSVGATSGTNTYTVTLVPAPAALVAGMQFLINFANANTTTSPTLNANGLGAKNLLRRGGGAPAAEDFIGWQRVFYDGTAFRLTSFAASEVIPTSPTASTTAAPLLKSIDAVISVNNSIPTSAPTVLSFQTTTRNNLGTSTWNGSRLTIGAGEAGLWYVQAAWSFFTPADGVFAAMQIRKNGSVVLGEGDYPYTKNGGGTIVQGHTILPLAAGGYIEAMAYHQSGSTQPAYAEARSRFFATLLSAY